MSKSVKWIGFSQLSKLFQLTQYYGWKEGTSGLPFAYSPYGKLETFPAKNCIVKVNFLNTISDNNIVFWLLIRTHKILSMKKSTVLKFNYSDSFVLITTLIYKYRLQWAWVQRYKFRKILRNCSRRGLISSVSAY